jgi:hypothetical protein
MTFTPGFEAAFIALCARIWWQLERLIQTTHQTSSRGSASEVLWLAATLRLELILILDSSDSERWRLMLTLEQRQTCRSMLANVLGLIGDIPDELTVPVIERAQDCLLEEVLTQCAAAAPEGVGGGLSEVAA